MSSRTFYRPSGTGNSDNPNMAKSLKSGDGRDFGMRLRYVRKLRDKTQEELAAASGLSQSAISDLEKGESKTPVGTNLFALAQTLQVDPEWFVTGKGNMDMPAPSTEAPLPARAVALAKDWLKLAPEVQESVHDMIRKMVKTSSADQEAAPDAAVANAYGRPGRRKPHKS